ncbi:uncharacterized protein LOC129741402 [Uranotaenia lowii]|uniref:uncharacterized protein LOC129741402 n=1 Tax=Uranotaenia lowii TaxID=190385 RepID=UPI002479740F|nr:uncharacterized protein LOC129741402 [Uranotaenia lowii]
MFKFVQKPSKVSSILSLYLKMETKSVYFSPRKTRNSIKQQNQGSNLKTKLLQKVVESKSTAIVSESASVPRIKIESAGPEPRLIVKKSRQRKPVKIETSPERTVETVEFPGHKTPIKDEPQNTPNMQSSLVVKRIKQDPDETGLFEGAKQIKWEPVNWRETLSNIRHMRQANPAPVDTMGCDQFKESSNASPKLRRFYTLVSLMLSSQTKDQVNFECMLRLQKHGLTPENMVSTDLATLEKLIYPVSFYKVSIVCFSETNKNDYFYTLNISPLK